MANEATAEEGLSENGQSVGIHEMAGRKADEVVALLREDGWTVRPKKLQPGQETKLTLEVVYGLEDSLFDKGE